MQARTVETAVILYIGQTDQVLDIIFKRNRSTLHVEHIFWPQKGTK